MSNYFYSFDQARLPSHQNKIQYPNDRSYYYHDEIEYHNYLFSVYADINSRIDELAARGHQLQQQITRVSPYDGIKNKSIVNNQTLPATKPAVNQPKSNMVAPAQSPTENAGIVCF